MSMQLLNLTQDIYACMNFNTYFKICIKRILNIHMQKKIIRNMYQFYL